MSIRATLTVAFCAAGFSYAFPGAVSTIYFGPAVKVSFVSTMVWFLATI